MDDRTELANPEDGMPRSITNCGATRCAERRDGYAELSRVRIEPARAAAGGELLRKPQEVNDLCEPSQVFFHRRAWRRMAPRNMPTTYAEDLR